MCGSARATGVPKYFRCVCRSKLVSSAGFQCPWEDVVENWHPLRFNTLVW